MNMMMVMVTCYVMMMMMTGYVQGGSDCLILFSPDCTRLSVSMVRVGGDGHIKHSAV